MIARINKALEEPYRVLFSLGLLLAILSVGVWLLFYMQKLSFYPKNFHSIGLFFGFFWCFVAGFFMTALPRMTGTVHANFLELGLACFLPVQLLALLALDLSLNFVMLNLAAQQMFLLVFLIRRFLLFRRLPFDGFFYIPAAFLFSLLGIGLALVDSSFLLNYFYSFSGEAFLLFLILGLGSRLIPLLSRVEGSLAPFELSSVRFLKPSIYIVLLGVSFIGEHSEYRLIFLGLRFVLLLVFSVFEWKVFAKKSQASIVGLGLFIGTFMLCLWPLVMIFSENVLLGRHILYLGGFTLITFMISSRVIWSHSGQGIEKELGSRYLSLGLLLIVGATITRVLGLMGVDFRFVYLAIALFLVLCVFWLWELVKSFSVEAKR